MAMMGHESPKAITDTWLTPPSLIRALGEFDLDPCCPPNMPWTTAKIHYTKEHDGLTQPWRGRVWCNPPYSAEAVRWLRKLADHGHGTALIFARVETAWFFETVWNRAQAILFMRGRVTFCDAQGVPAKANAGAASCLIAYGDRDADVLANCRIEGQYVRLREPLGVFA